MSADKDVDPSLQQSCPQLELERRHKLNVFFTVKFSLLLGTSAVFLITTKENSSKLTTFVWYTSGLVLIWLLYDMFASLTVGWLTEKILRHVFQAAHYFARLLFIDLWKSRPKKRRP